MREHERPEVRRLPLFRSMSPESFAILADACYTQRFPAQLELVREGDSADFLHVVIEGSVELYARWRGRETTMGVVRPVGTFILAACIRDQPYLMSARTLTRTRIILIPAHDLRAMFRKDTEFALAVIDELAGCFRAMARHAKGLKLRNSRERIAAYILRQSRLAGGASGFTLPVEKRLLASYLGMTPENLSRALRMLEQEGIRVQGQRIVITDRDRLTALADPDPLLDGPDDEHAVNAGSGLPAARALPE